MIPERVEQLDSILKDHEWRYAWCDAIGGCACSGCVNVGLRQQFTEAGIPKPTLEEFYEYSYHALITELAEAQDLLDEHISLNQQKKIPTLQEYRNRLVLIDKTREWLKRKGVL